MERILSSLVLCFVILSSAWTQTPTDSLFNAKTFAGLEFRNIGPAMTSGRISDIAVHPENQNIIYVTAGSGNVWKTVNAGTSWTPIFEKYGSYSIGCIAIDPSNPNILWLGTGENVGGRHVGIGDGIYRSKDAGKSWKKMGLEKSEHISKIIIHPKKSDIIWAAVQGPLWSKGGERGVYKSTDGGESWVRTLGNDEWIGATDIALDPRDPNLVYAATWQRHRTVAAYLGGGPGSGLHRSMDGGVSWEKLSKGIPKSNLGKIGIAISPQNPDRIYAAIELDRRKGGLFMSADRGSSWTKQSDMVAGGTGPHYYQELYVDPHQEGRIYLMNNRVLISDDHGKTYHRMNEDKKHIDTHAMVFRANDPDYIMMGTDGGIYETFDRTKTWRFVRNLPLVQYYKVAVDDALPFYNVFGGTQDNGSHKGPSRTSRTSGIHNGDWSVILGADGHQSATEPGNPNISYGEYQQGVLFRIDHTTGESVLIKPEESVGDPHERFNWDAPILVSPHDPKRLYFASYRLWRSDNRGDDWEAVSGDLTKNLEPLSQPIMGKLQSWDNAWDIWAMSNYSTITSISESPIQEGLLYVGTDDGIIQISENGGDSWQKMEIGEIKGIPATAFVNDIRADLFNANVVYAALDNHKFGDYKPYLIRSENKGKKWQLINGDLPAKLLVWRLVQDHVNPDLMFIATEYGIYFTIDAGKQWIRLKGGTPTISFRDVTIQRRENDLVAASFGRGFYILDDYSLLRNIKPDELQKEAILFKPRKAYWYTELNELYGQGNSEYSAKNPPYGATFSYYLKEKLKSKKDARKKNEKELAKKKLDTPLPDWDELEAEIRQDAPAIYLTIRDADQKIIRKLKGKNKAGMNRISWNLRKAPKDVVKLDVTGDGTGNGTIKVVPGTYTLSLSKLIDGQWTELSESQEFEVVPLRKGTLPGASYEDILAYQQLYENYQQEMGTQSLTLKKAYQKINAFRVALSRADQQPRELMAQIHETKTQLDKLDKKLNGLKSKREVGARNVPGPKVSSAGFAGLNTTYGPTGTHKKAMERSRMELAEFKTELSEIVDSLIPEIEEEMATIGAPVIEGHD